MAGVRKGKGRKFGHGTECKGEERRGMPARKPLFLPSRILIMYAKITQQ